MLDPARIAVGGGLMGSGRRVLAALGARLRDAVPLLPELGPARFGPDEALRGAVGLALDGVQSSQGADGHDHTTAL